MLELLAPEERAAFLPHEAFDFQCADIGRILDKNEAACRQVVHRAREHVKGSRKRFEATAEAKKTLLRTFSQAVQESDSEALLKLFAESATWVADGGGKVPAAAKPILGGAAIVELLLNLKKNFWFDDRKNRKLEIEMINGEPGLAVVDAGKLTGVVSIETGNEQITEVYTVLNPDKLSAAGL